VSLKNLISHLKKRKNKKLLIIIGQKTYKNYLIKFLVSKLKTANKIVKIYFVKSFLPNVEEIKIIIKEFNIFQPDVILGVGGGKVIDYSKLLGVVEFSKKKNNLFKNVNFRQRKCSLYIVPTIAGSGSESTNFSVLYVGKKKFSLESKYMIVNKVFFIPQFVGSIPERFLNAAVIDTISQSIEAIFSRKANKISLEYSRKSINLFRKNFLGYIKNKTVKNTSGMLFASNYSGKSINIAKTNGPHSISYFFTKNYEILHGEAVSIFFKQFIKFYFYKMISNKDKKLKKKFNFLFKITNSKNIFEFFDFYQNFINKTKINKIISSYKINYKAIYKNIIKGINKDRLSNCPVTVSTADLKKIIINN
jgi:alcohol dehydrogenase class IV